MPFHWGGNGIVKGCSANDLLAISGEPNVTIMESKALTCGVVPGTLPSGRGYQDFMEKYVPKNTPENLHPEQPPPGAPQGGKSVLGQAQHGKGN
jgi:formate dehydrogenase major subunit